MPGLASADALPDGRVYEQVSPVQKSGNDAGGVPAPATQPKYAVATADGQGLFYGVRGPMGTTHRGLQDYAVGHRQIDGWSSESAIPAGSSERIYSLSYAPHDVLPSADLSRVVFGAFGSYVPDNPQTLNTSSGLYLGNADGSVDWLTRPQIPNPNPAPGSIASLSFMQPVGASPDLSTVYFWSGPTLLPEDAPRAAVYDPTDPDARGPFGMYEYTNGVLKPAGTLPDGSESAGGAAPASSGGSFRVSVNFTVPDAGANQVSRDGKSLWFVSPDPGPDPSQSPPAQLYVRRNGHSTLVSRNTSGAPTTSGATAIGGYYAGVDPRSHRYAWGSPDGMSAVFNSVDALTSDAPNDSSIKAYMYDVASDKVTYLPGVVGTVVASSDDGQRFLFGDVDHIGVWDHGTVKNLASVGGLQLAPARATTDGSVFVFTTQAPIPGFNNGSGVVQVYRYDVAKDQTLCLSCPPDGVTPTGDARLQSFPADGQLLPNRAMTDDANQVYFDSPDPLVPRDTNGTHRDVYEWSATGGVSLISSGRSQDESYFLDNGADGKDVFFTTTEGLNSADTDGGYDVYDARVGGGFADPGTVGKCQGDGCQGNSSPPPSVLQSSSNVFSGPGNEAPPAPKPPASTKLTLGSHKAVKGGVELTVKMARPGRVTVTGSGLKSYKKTYAKAGTYKIKVTLTAKAKQTAKKHKLKLSVRVGFTPNAGKASSVKFSLTAKA